MQYYLLGDSFKMKKKQLEQRIVFFQALNGLCKKDKFCYINDCPDVMIDIICEACHNLLKLNTLKNQRSVKNKAKLFGKCLEKLSCPQTSIKSKRNLLKSEEVGKAVFSLLANTVLPELKKLKEK